MVNINEKSLTNSQKNSIISLVISIIGTIAFYIWILKPLNPSNMWIYLIIFFIVALGVVANSLNKNKAYANLADKEN
ncbi:MAG: hypothetical protein WCY27_04145 [archaeon]|nr:hypothetical protein [archaeon]